MTGAPPTRMCCAAYVRSHRHSSRVRLLRTLIIIAPLLRIRTELEKDITLLDFPLPTESEIRRVLDQMIDANTANNSPAAHRGRQHRS